MMSLYTRILTINNKRCAKYCQWVLVIICSLVLVACQPSHSPEMVVITGETMGTSYTVKYVIDKGQQLPTPEEVKQAIDRQLQEVNNEMSTYISSSEISRFNQLNSCDTFHRCTMRISPDFATVVREAIHLNKVTQGALDITIGPLVNIWGFGADKTNVKSPDLEQLTQVKQIIGLDKISLEGDILSKKIAGVYLDLSSIAKGFGVDKVAYYLDTLSLKNYLVEIGGELRVKGKNRQNQLWHIGIEHPTVLQHQSNQLILPLDNLAMATSGDYRNFHLDQYGRRLSHIINPQTLQPISHRLASITVIHTSTMTADGLATGLFVLGEQKALEIAEKEHLPIFLIIREGDKFETKMSSAFRALIRH